MQVDGIQRTGEIERLRNIIRQTQGRPVEYDEALEVGESLISFFKTLAGQDGMDDEEQDD